MQVILTQSPDGSWGYVVLTDGRLTASDSGYDSPSDALGDALSCPTLR